MSSTVESSLGALLHDSRTAIGMSLQEVAEHAGCSTAYVHKLEQGRVRTPSPRVLAGLARTLGLEYNLVMQTAGYDPPALEDTDRSPVVPRFSNAHIVQVLEAIRADVAELRKDLDRLASKG